MEFKEALAKVYRAKRNMNKLYNPLVLHGCISDLIGNSIKNKEKAMLFYKVDKEVGFFKSIVENNQDTSKLKNQYSKVSNIIDKKRYNDIIDIILQIVRCDGKCFFPGQQKAQNTNPKSKKKKQVNNVQKQNNVKAQKPNNVPVATPIQNTNSTPKYNTNTNSSSGTNMLRVLFSVIGMAILIIGVVLLGVYGKRIEWYQWQHIIGSIGGLLLLGGLFAICYIWDDAETFSVELCVVVILNLVLAFILKDKYSTICYWLFAYTFISLIAWFLYGMEECVEDPYLAIAIITFICNIVLLIFYIIYSKGIFPPTNLSYVGEQCVIGACLIVTIIVCLFLICYQLEDVATFDMYATAVIILILVAVINYVLAFTLKNDYRIICYWLAPASIVGMIIGCFSVDDVDMPVPVAVIATIANIIMLIIYCFIDRFVFI